MSSFNVALAQMEIIPGRPDLNIDIMLNMISEAKQAGAEMIVFPEMALSGYLLGNTWEQSSFLRDCEAYGRQIVKASGGIYVIFGNVSVDWGETGDDGRVRKYNALFIARDGKLYTEENSLHPFIIKMFDSSNHFYSLKQLLGEQGKRTEGMQSVVLNIAGRNLRVGIILGDDFLNYKGKLDLLIKTTSSPFILGETQKSTDLTELACTHKVPLIYVNNVGVQNNGKTVYAFEGGSAVYSNKGAILGDCSVYNHCLKIFSLNLNSQEYAYPSTSPAFEQDISEIYNTVIYGIKGFLRSIEMKRVVIGISGGIDSALSAVLYSLAIGPDNVLLVNMPSIYNSAVTQGFAERLAGNLGCPYMVVPIQDSVNYTINQINKAYVTRLRDESRFNLEVTSFMQENMQARDRSARVLAGLAAAFGGGFTCNANKSELTVGYSTFYGDQAGCFAALADLWKYQVYDLARYINEHVFKKDIIPEGIFELVPSAELSPEQAVEKGKGDPIIYPYHDYLFRAFVERGDRVTPEEILEWYHQGCLEENIGCEIGLVSKVFKNPQEFINDLERWWQAYTGVSVAKRIQSPPVLAVSRRPFGLDHMEAQNRPYFSLRYKKLKHRILIK